jgi:hypothetical protein
MELFWDCFERELFTHPLSFSWQKLPTVLKKNSGFAVSGLAILRNLLICDCGMNPSICGIAMCEKKFASVGYLLVEICE